MEAGSRPAPARRRWWWALVCVLLGALGLYWWSSRPTRLRGHRKTIYCLAYSPDGSLLASGGSDDALRVWDVKGRRVLWAVTDFSYTVTAVAFSPDGAVLAASSDADMYRHEHGDGCSGEDGKQVRVYDARTGAELTALRKPQCGSVQALAFSPDGRLLATYGYLVKGVRLWDTSTWAEHAALGVKNGPSFYALAFSSDGKVLAATGPGGDEVQLWDVVGRKALLTLKSPRRSEVTSIALSPDGQTLAAGTRLEDAVELWDCKTGSLVHVLESWQLTGEVRSVAFSPDGQTLAAGEYIGRGFGLPSSPLGAHVRFWDVPTGKALGARWWHSEGVLALTYSPAGGGLAVGDGAGDIRLYDLPGGR